MPLLLAPFFLFFVYPFHLLVLKISKPAGAKKYNFVICALLYSPVCFAQLLLFIVLNLLLVPFAYIGGIFQIITQNPYQDRKLKRNKFVQVSLFVLLGIPFLLLCQFPNAWFCVKSLYAPKQNSDALAFEKDKQAPVNTKNIQKMYQCVSQEVLDHSTDAARSQPGDKSK